MNALWINAEIATCVIAGRAANCGRRNATRRALKRVNGKAALGCRKLRPLVSLFVFGLIGKSSSSGVWNL